MQINFVDSFAATAFTSIEAFCCTLKELDPCTAAATIPRWLERYGVRRSACDPAWTLDIKKLLVCLLAKISNNFVLTKANLEKLAAYFGVKVAIYKAGDFNCAGVPGFWTFDRQRVTGNTPPGCAPVDACVGTAVIAPQPSLVQLQKSCTTIPSIDIVVCRAATTVPSNCLLPGPAVVVQPSQALYDAFFWLMTKVVPINVDICFYRCEETPCGGPV